MLVLVRSAGNEKWKEPEIIHPTDLRGPPNGSFPTPGLVLIPYVRHRHDFAVSAAETGASHSGFGPAVAALPAVPSSTSRRVADSTVDETSRMAGPLRGQKLFTHELRVVAPVSFPSLSGEEISSASTSVQRGSAISSALWKKHLNWRSCKDLILADILVLGLEGGARPLIFMVLRTFSS